MGEVDRDSWENGNVVHYAYLPQQEITYEYDSQLRPENFPFRVVNSFRPVGFDMISPLKLAVWEDESESADPRLLV